MADGGPVPYTAYKSKRAQAQAQAQGGNASNYNKPPSRPSSFMGGDVWDKAQLMIGGIVKGAEDMGQGLVHGLAADRQNGGDALHLFGKANPPPSTSTPRSTSPPHPAPRTPPAQQPIPQINGHTHEQPSSSPPPVIPCNISVSPPTSPTRMSPETSTQPSKPTMENGLPSPPASEPDMNPESSGNGDNESERMEPKNSAPSEDTSHKTDTSTSVGTASPASSPGASSSKLQLPPSPTRTQARKSSSFRYVPRTSPLGPHAIPSSRTLSSSTRPTPLSPGPPTPSNKLTYDLHLPSTLDIHPRGRLPSFASSVLSTSPSHSPQSAPQDLPKRSESLRAFSPLPSTTPASSPYIRGISPSPAPSHRTQPIQSTAQSTAPSTVTSPQMDAAKLRSGTPSSDRTLKAPARPARAPYRPGFQPKGVYRPRTDEFVTLRRQYRDGSGVVTVRSPDRWDSPLSRMERTKLERRLEKIIQLHFPPPSEQSVPRERRQSFFGTLSASLSLSASSNDSIHSDGRELSKAEIRAAEQRITPWEADNNAKVCWVCQTTFHPLTNRKHHCRLCGRIVCALPVSNKMTTTEANAQPRPLRPTKCSYLFVVDTDAKGQRSIEEVGEGVDYGVKRTRSSSGSYQVPQDLDDDRFLRAVRICRSCRPILLRTQYSMEMAKSHEGGPQADLARLYEVMINLEKEIEDRLPAFYELLNSAGWGPDAAPSPQLAIMRKHIMESFTSYDAVAKRIAALPHEGKKGKGKTGGTAQERIQTAILMRARIFLEKNMVPLKKSLSSVATASNPGSRVHSPAVGENDPKASLTAKEKKVYEELQPLLEQEALLETFVEQAQASRKFEDVRTLRQNLIEIREEINRVLKAQGLETGKKTAKKSGNTVA